MQDDRAGATWVHGIGARLVRRVLPTQTISVGDLMELDLARLDGEDVVVYESKGSASHAEVVCRIKGIPLVLKGDWDTFSTSDGDVTLTRSVPADAVSAYVRFERQYQVSATHPKDLDGLDLDRVSSVFVRMEHLLLRALGGLQEQQRDLRTLGPMLRAMVESFCEVLPPNAHLLLRGADVRSDDPILGPHFHSASEANPEMGFHGVRWLLENPEWVELEATLVAGLNGRVAYGVPFVTRNDDYVAFARRHEADFPLLVPFVESPAAMWAIDPSVSNICVGLKDASQFFFGADRANGRVSAWVDFIHPDLMSFASAIIEKASGRGGAISLYQDLTMFPAYFSLLGNARWVPSFAAGELVALRTAYEAAEREGRLW